MSIYINGTALSPAPQELSEEIETISSTQQAINGNKQQVIVGTITTVKMTWSWTKPALVKFFENLSSSGDTITYRNDNSSKYGILEFTGVIKVSSGDYLRGGSGLVPLTVTIEEGENF